MELERCKLPWVKFALTIVIEVLLVSLLNGEATQVYKAPGL